VNKAAGSRVHTGVVLALLIAATSAAAQALPPVKDRCECVFQQRKAACETAWSPAVSAVFVGTVTNIDRRPIGEGDTVELQPVHILRGNVASPVKVEIETARCSPWVFSDPFADGQRYIVYAAKGSSDGVLRINACSRVASIGDPDSQQDVRYWSGIAAIRDNSVVFGTVKQYAGEKESHGFHELDEEKVFVVEPLEGEEIQITGEGKKIFTTTDLTGRYEVRGLTPGHYTVSVHNFARPLFRTAHEVEIPPKGCAEVDFRRMPGTGETVFHDSGRSAAPPQVKP